MNGGPAVGTIAVTPNDTTDISVTRGLYVGVTGDVKVKMYDGSVVTFKGLSGGMVHPLSVSRVYNGGTSATDILAVY